MLRTCDKIFWVIVVIIGFTCGSLIVGSAVQGWIDNPAIVFIESFAKANRSITIN